MMECDIRWEVHPFDRISANKPPPLTVPMLLGQRIVIALLDMRSPVSLVRAHLVPQGKPIRRYTALAGVYRRVCQWPVVQFPLRYNGRSHLMEVLKVDYLPYLVLFVHDVPDFETLLKNAINPTAATLSEDEEAGPNNKRDDNKGPIEAAGWSVDPEFLEAQSSDASLEPAIRALALKEDIVLDEQRPGRLPCFKQVRGVLWQVATARKEGGTPRRQLLVPLQYRAQIS